jgi:ferritin-like metal-binding protein YciE
VQQRSTMTRVDRRVLIGSLNDAHAMEARSLTVLRREATDPQQRVDVRARLESHLHETVQHAERLRQALHALGTVPTAVGSHAEPVMVLATDITGRVFSDPLVRKVIAALAAKQFEVAAYTALIAAAEYVGEAEVARLCRLNRGEDEDMAEWLDAQIPITLGHTLGRIVR